MKKFPTTLVQRCQVHKIQYILTKLPHLVRLTLKKLILGVSMAFRYKGGLAQARAVIAEYRNAFPSAMKRLERDLEGLTWKSESRYDIFCLKVNRLWGILFNCQVLKTVHGRIPR